ncbi:hypothetical protein Cadr_000017699 [Camelus dromedarius]|uniref:Uncharacterized protein n=1 Tax=Camelus dromedarius TaxID=9838 RepID=A0A5N4D6U4_CAMDR|nr:hypothetical protein Cadr_000017699 [Camelus dromedarius]
MSQLQDANPGSEMQSEEPQREEAASGGSGDRPAPPSPLRGLLSWPSLGDAFPARNLPCQLGVVWLAPGGLVPGVCVASSQAPKRIRTWSPS